MKKCIHPVYLIFVCTLNMRSVGEMKHCFSFASFKSWCLFLILVNEECNGWKKHLHHCQDKVASSTHFSTKQFETRPGDVSSWACSHALATGHCASGVSANGLALAGRLGAKGKLGKTLWGAVEVWGSTRGSLVTFTTGYFIWSKAFFWNIDWKLKTLQSKKRSFLFFDLALNPRSPLQRLGWLQKGLRSIYPRAPNFKWRFHAG